MNLPESKLPRGPLVLSYREQIAAKHAQGKAADFELREAILRNLEIKRQTGELIKSARGTLHASEFDTVTDFLDRDTVRSYLKFAKQHEEPITDLQAGLRSIAVAMQTTGLLPMPDGHVAQVSHDPPPFPAWSAKMVMQYKAFFAKYLAARPLKNWTADEKEQFCFSLRPILKIHKMISESFVRR